jgi:hypothetical protein
MYMELAELTANLKTAQPLDDYPEGPKTSSRWQGVGGGGGQQVLPGGVEGLRVWQCWDEHAN